MKKKKKDGKETNDRLESFDKDFLDKKLKEALSFNKKGSK